MDADEDATVESLRAEIAARDETIVRAVNERVALVAELHRHKAESGYPIIDRSREHANLARLEALNEGPLSPAGLQRLYDEVLALTKSELASRTP